MRRVKGRRSDRLTELAVASDQVFGSRVEVLAHVAEPRRFLIAEQGLAPTAAASFALPSSLGGARQPCKTAFARPAP